MDQTSSFSFCRDHCLRRSSTTGLNQLELVSALKQFSYPDSSNAFRLAPGWFLIRSQHSMMIQLTEKPIQNATPKNSWGPRCVNRLVAKKTPITGRVVAIPRRTAIALISQRLFSILWPLTLYCQARPREKQNRVSKKRTALRSIHPPTEYTLIA